MAIKSQESELFGIYSQFLDLMKNEKAAKETYLKSVISNTNKVRDIRGQLEKESGHKFVIMIDLLKIYGEVLGKLQATLANEVAYMEDNFINKLANTLKEGKAVKDKIQNSVDLMHKYMKHLGKIENYRRAMFDSYYTYEQNTLVDEAINKVVRTYSDESPKKFNDYQRNQFTSKEYDYSTAVLWFNDEAPGMIKQNVNNSNKEC